MTETAIYRDRYKNYRVFQLETLSEGVDLPDAVRKAAVEYVHSGQGLDPIPEGEGFTMKRFFEQVPDEICIRHGFRKRLIKGPGFVKDEDMILTPAELCMMERYGAENFEARRGMEELIQLAMLWGVAQGVEHDLNADAYQTYYPTVADVNRVRNWSYRYIQSNHPLKDFFRAEYEAYLGE